MIDRTCNAGVDNNNGMALQRNTAIFLLLENYVEKFQNKKYFICLEHHDDFLFCFLNENNEAETIEAYQSKKKAPDIWRLNKELYDILKKLLNTGKKLITDEILKSNEYKHILFFSTNQTIKLEEKQDEISIKADNISASYSDLPSAIKEKIKTNISDEDLCDELDNLGFLYIPFTTTSKEQENQLEGKVTEVFGNEIYDKRAAVDALILLFHKIENTYNQGNIVKLLDETKRVTNSQVEEAFNVLTTKAKCFDYWHSQETAIARKLQIRPIEKEQFKLDFSSAFDLFKSIKEAEHKKILNFVDENKHNLSTYSEEENVSELYDLFKKSERTNFNDLQLKAILFAALFEVLNIK